MRARMPPHAQANELDRRVIDSILDAVEPLDGARVLDLACGAGDLSLALIDRGARVTGLDISGAQVAIASQRVERFRPQAEADFRAAPAEDTGLPDDAFDAVVGQWALHHLDLPAAAVEMRRILKPGGRGSFMETSALNPALNLGRSILGRFGTSRIGTDDEHPLAERDLAVLRQTFPECSADFPIFLFFHLAERHFLDGRRGRMGRALVRADAAIERRARPLVRYSYCMRVRLRA